MDLININGAEYDRKREIKAFDESKVGVKGLVDAGISKVPRMFHRPPSPPFDTETQFSLPLVDLEAAKDPILRPEIVDRIRRASETWGFFQVVNHGIPHTVMEEMLKGARRFFDQDCDVKKQFYTRDLSRPVIYNSNIDLYVSDHATWRDTMFCTMAPTPPRPQDLPQVCRDIMYEYSKHGMKVGALLLELLSEGVGLKPNHFKEMGIAETLLLTCHCYPPCPEPELTLGGAKHSDKFFLTILLQDEIGGLQVLHRDHWIHVPPLRAALVVNIGDLLQLITNDKLKSVEHRVVANANIPRYSVASFFTTSMESKPYGPIKELLSEDEPPKYRDITVQEFQASYIVKKGVDGASALLHFNL